MHGKQRKMCVPLVWLAFQGLMAHGLPCKIDYVLEVTLPLNAITATTMPPRNTRNQVHIMSLECVVDKKRRKKSEKKASFGDIMKTMNNCDFQRKFHASLYPATAPTQRKFAQPHCWYIVRFIFHVNCVNFKTVIDVCLIGNTPFEIIYALILCHYGRNRYIKG